MAEKEYRKTVKEIAYNEYSQVFLNYTLKNQQEILAERKVPIKLTKESFTLYGKNEEILHALTADQMKGEFAWFCTSPYLLQNQSKGEPLVTCDLDILAQLDPKNTFIEHEEYIEIIGNIVA